VRQYENETKLLSGIFEQTAREYEGMAVPLSCKRLSGGERNDIFKLDFHEGSPLVLRIIHHKTELSGVLYTNTWSAFAASRIKEAISPRLTKTGDSIFIHNGMICEILPFVEGVNSDRELSIHRDEIAKIQARLHNIGLQFPDQRPRPDRPRLLEFDFENNYIYNWEAVDKMLSSGGKALFSDPRHQSETEQEKIAGIYERREALYKGKEEFIKLTESLKKRRDLLYAPIHGDLYGPNVLMKDDRIAGILDWDECGNEMLVYELGRVLWEYCKNPERDGFDRDRSAQYLAAYKAEGGPVPEDEWDLMVPLLRYLKYIEVMLYVHNSIIGDVWDPAYGLENIKALIALGGAGYT
jgi:Ser/Thr protein kinase RdoA (MazF antagonist)